MSVRGAFQLQQGDFKLSVNFDTPPTGVTALFGHSGSGKTTLLRCIAGLERADIGQLYFKQTCWQDSSRHYFMPPHQRPLGYVFQEASLFPHLSVRKNLEYGMRRTPTAERRVVFSEAVDLLGVAPLLNRKPDKLSGGERQRVAIARALLTSPRLLLMDEPMAALDSHSKADILPYLEKLHEELSIPVLYISHSLPEVMKLADHIFLMKDGQIIAAGPLQEVVARPDLPFMQAEDAGGVINATVKQHDPHYHLTTLAFNGGELMLPLLKLAIGAPVRVQIPARDVSIALSHDVQSSILNILPATVVQTIQDDRGHYLVQLAIGEAFLLARISFKSKELLQLRSGLKVFAQVKSMGLL